MNKLEKGILDFMNSFEVSKKQPVWVATSGGVDSLVLAHVLLKHHFNISLIHCNFQLRGLDSEGDHKFILNYAKDQNIKLFDAKFATRGYAKENSLSIQLAARELRYNFFNGLLKEHPDAIVVLGHHADDSLETMLLNITRGSGLMPLAGIQPRREHYLRPLWLNSKEEIVNFARDEGLSWREDISNQSDAYQRNYLRIHVIPEYKNLVEQFDLNLRSTLQRSYEDRQLFASLIAEQLEKVLVKEVGVEKLSLAYFSNYSDRSALLYHWLKPHGDFDFEAIQKSIKSPKTGKYFETPKARLLIDRNFLVLSLTEPTSTEAVFINEEDADLQEPVSMKFEISDAENRDIPTSTKVAVMDFETLEFPLTLRTWQEGDRFQPLGMKGSKKLSDFLTDEKIDRFQKDNTWLLCSGNNICWVVGHRIDDRYKITNKTKKVYFAQVYN